MLVAGKQKRPDSSYSRSILNKAGEIIGQIGEGNRKDIRDAVQAAVGALSGSVAIYNFISLSLARSSSLSLELSKF